MEKFFHLIISCSYHISIQHYIISYLYLILIIKRDPILSCFYPILTIKLKIRKEDWKSADRQIFRDV